MTRTRKNSDLHVRTQSRSEGARDALSPPVLFHGTTTDRLAEILSRGLSAPYLTDLEEAARYYAETTAEMEESNPVVLSLTLDERDLEFLEADLRSYGEPLSFVAREHTGGGRDWADMLADGTLPYPTGLGDWATSLAIVHSVRLTCNIDRDRIRVHGQDTTPELPQTAARTRAHSGGR